MILMTQKFSRIASLLCNSNEVWCDLLESQQNITFCFPAFCLHFLNFTDVAAKCPILYVKLKFQEKYQGSSHQFSLPEFVNKIKAPTSPVHCISVACSRTDSFLLQYLWHLQCKTHQVFRHGADVSGLATVHPVWLGWMGQFNKTEISLTHCHTFEFVTEVINHYPFCWKLRRFDILCHELLFTAVSVNILHEITCPQ